MPKNDEGEFELVLGNRQLISVFLIVVILLGVFFSMGYIVGRNSASGGSEAARAAKGAAELPPDTSASATSPAPPAESSPAPAAESKAQGTDQGTTRAEPSAPAPETTKPTPAGAAKQKKAAAAPSERASVTGEPAPGQYWQVVATARPDAEIVAEALGRKGMQAIIAPAPKEGFFRVLVGPLPDAAAQAQTRSQLEAAGFKNPIVRKY